MLATDFNFAITRGSDGGLTVLSSIDEGKLLFDRAAGIVVATTQIFRTSLTEELWGAARRARESVEST